MIATLGLTHLSLAVRDPERSLAFYAKAFGVREYFRDDTQIQVLGPGPHDVLAFERDPDNAGRVGGIGHFGFRLARPQDIDGVVDGVLAAGGTLLRRGEFAPGLPFAHVADPDGYEIELWFEPEARVKALEAPSAPAPTSTPSVTRRATIDTSVRAHRCLRRLHNYTPALPSRQHTSEDLLGALVGTYRNPGADGAIVRVHADGLRWQGGAQTVEVPFDDLVGIRAPGGETTETLTLVLANGIGLSLPVRGRDGRFCDSTAMLRFLERVREDRRGRRPAVPQPAP